MLKRERYKKEGKVDGRAKLSFCVINIFTMFHGKYRDNLLFFINRKQDPVISHPQTKNHSSIDL